MLSLPDRELETAPDASPPEDEQPVARRASSAILPLLVGCLIVAVALIPRLLDLDQHATADEDLTLIRGANVALALESRDWWGTYQIGHPEATVQLVVALGLGPDTLRPYAGDFLGPGERVSARVPGYFDVLVQARRLMVPVHAVLIALAALLVWRMWGALPGVLSGLLLALEPFMVAHGRILRTDALLAELMIVAVLAALVYWSGRGGWWALAVCTIASGLAFLTKTPALALLGAVPAAAWAGTYARDDAPSLSLRVWSVVGGTLLWVFGAAVVFVGAWPAIWVRPLRALERMAVYTQEKGGSPMDAGGFFLGSPVADPGLLYYPVALALRLSPLVLVGLALWLLLRAPRWRRGVGLVLLVGVGLILVLGLLPKKADRYVLPAMPFLVVVASVGLATLAERWRSWGALATLGAVLAVEWVLLALVWPYPLASYDPLLGGGATAEDVISVGWGEGLDQLAPVLNARPDADRLTVSSPYPEVLQAQIAGRAVDLDAYDLADYVVRYVAASQRALSTPALDAALAGRTPLQWVEIAGITYAELYPLDPPEVVGNIQLRQVDVLPRQAQRRSWITVTLTLGPPSAPGYSGRLALTGFTEPVDVEAVLLNSARLDDVEASTTRSLRADGSTQEIKLRLPNSLGRYVVGLTVRDPVTGRPFAVTNWPVGAPRQPDRLVYPSLSVRSQ